MLTFYFHPTPNPMKVAMFLHEAELAFELKPVDTLKGEQHDAAFRKINPNAKLPAIEDDGVRVFDSNAILLYLGDKHQRFVGTPADRAELLSWLMFIASGLGPYSGQSVHFSGPHLESAYASKRYLREAERHYGVMDEHLQGREFFVGNAFSIVDMAAWGWVDRASRVLGDDRLGEWSQIKRWFDTINARPSVAKARALSDGVDFKSDFDEQSARALFPQNYDD